MSGDPTNAWLGSERIPSALLPRLGMDDGMRFWFESDAGCDDDCRLLLRLRRSSPNHILKLEKRFPFVPFDLAGVLLLTAGIARGLDSDVTVSKVSCESELLRDGLG